MELTTNRMYNQTVEPKVLINRIALLLDRRGYDVEFQNDQTITFKNNYRGFQLRSEMAKRVNHGKVFLEKTAAGVKISYSYDITVIYYPIVFIAIICVAIASEQYGILLIALMVFASFFVRLMGIRETADEFLAEIQDNNA